MATLQLPSIKPSVITPVRATPLIFSHPAIDRGQPFVIDTGASSIKWPYKMNVKVTPTYAGEVVQILSIYVDTMTISGQTRDAEQLRSIYSWFLRYMQIAGLADRNQQAMTFQYPERGWQFLIQPNSLPEFQYNRDLLAVEWKVQAEVVQDDAPLAGYTMNGFTRAAFDPSMWDVGFNAEDPRVNPLSPFNSDPDTAQNLGDNFQALIGAWSSGDFAHWAFDATQSPKANSLKDSKEYWTEVFGTDFLTKNKSSANSGASPYGGPANPDGPAAIAYMISQAFAKHGVPGKVGVAVAMAESGLDPDKFQYPIGSPHDPGGYGAGTPVKGQTGVGLFQTTNVSGGEQLLADRAVQNFPDHITKVFSAVQMAEYAAARMAASTQSSNLGQWAWNFQRPADEAGYVKKINGLLDRAQSLITQGKKESGSGLGGKAIEIAHTQLGYHETGSNQTKYGEEYGLNGEPWCAMFATWCLKRAGSTAFRYASVAEIVLDARAGKNGLVILDQPEPGCLACFDFDSAHAAGESAATITADSGHEHVTFFENWVHAGDTFVGLGGNQSDSVSESQFQKANVIEFIRVTR